MTPQHEADLSWYYSGEGAAAVSGVRSPSLEWSPGGDADADDKAIARLAVTRRHKRIDASIARCAASTRAVLRAHYERRHWSSHPEIRARLGALAGVVVHVARHRHGITLDPLATMLVRGTPADRSTLTTLRAEATLALRAAHDDYCQSAPHPLRSP